MDTEFFFFLLLCDWCVHFESPRHSATCQTGQKGPKSSTLLPLPSVFALAGHLEERDHTKAAQSMDTIALESEECKGMSLLTTLKGWPVECKFCPFVTIVCEGETTLWPLPLQFKCFTYGTEIQLTGQPVQPVQCLSRWHLNCNFAVANWSPIQMTSHLQSDQVHLRPGQQFNCCNRRSVRSEVQVTPTGDGQWLFAINLCPDIKVNRRVSFIPLLAKLICLTELPMTKQIHFRRTAVTVGGNTVLHYNCSWC